jgi:hypothetical protein
MFKKVVILSVAVALIMLGLFVDPSSAQVTSVSKRGSLLIYPKINTFTSSERNVDTIVTIANDAASASWVKCYWMDSTQAAWDFEFKLTANMPAWFSAKTGVGSVDVSEFGDNKTGELKCWAVDIDPPAPAVSEVAVKFNFLYGSAIIIESLPHTAAFEYQAWAFAVNTAQAFSTAGPLNLNGAEYDNCPGYLVYNFFSADEESTEPLFTADGSVLSLSPCQQDLRQDKTPVCTKAKFDIWNENEAKLTGAYQCVKCWFESELDEIGALTWQGCDVTKIANGKCKFTGFGGNKFTVDVIHTDLGRFRVNPLATTDTFAACKGVFSKLDLDGKTLVDVCPAANQFRTPFVGVLVTKLDVGSDDVYAATTGTAAGSFSGGTNIGGGGPAPLIKWDAGEIQQAPKR